MLILNNLQDQLNPLECALTKKPGRGVASFSRLPNPRLLPSPHGHTTKQVYCLRLSPLFATLTKTAGVYPLSSQIGTTALRLASLVAQGDFAKATQEAALLYLELKTWNLRLPYAVGRRAISFLTAWGGIMVAILRIIAKTRRLSPSESVVLYFLISARKRISSCESSPRAFCVSRSRGVSVPGKKSASEMSMASAILARVSSDGTVWPFSTRER